MKKNTSVTGEERRRRRGGGRRSINGMKRSVRRREMNRVRIRDLGFLRFVSVGLKS
ncbi:hypothetical protein LguiA_001629 [Lonicera macranthoides]